MSIDPKQFSRIVSGVNAPAWGDCVFWFDAGNPASLPSTASPITDFLDVTNNVSPAAVDLSTAPPTLVDSHINYANDVIILNGSRPSNTFNIFNGGGTLAFWIRVESTPGNPSRLIDTRGGSNSQGYYFGVRPGNNTTGFRLEFGRRYTIANGAWRSSAPGGAGTSSQGLIPFNQWVHIVISFTDAPATGVPYPGIGSLTPPKMYVNGTEILSVDELFVADGSVIDETNAFMRFGARASGGSNPFDGQIDMMAAWSKVLSNDEVMQHYAATRSAYQGGTGFQLLDRVGTSVATSTLTLNGLASEYDAVYLVVGRIVDSSSSSLFEIQPVPGIALASIQSTIDVGVPGSTSTFTSATGWLVAVMDRYECGCPF
jgi:hypothetical protein